MPVGNVALLVKAALMSISVAEDLMMGELEGLFPYMVNTSLEESPLPVYISPSIVTLGRPVISSSPYPWVP